MAENETLNNAIVNAQQAFYDLLKKLEDDGYLKSMDHQKIALGVVEEMHSIASLIAQQKELPKEENGKLHLPDGYAILNRFDKMSREYDGVFWAKMKVETPECLTKLYEELLVALIKQREEDGKIILQWQVEELLRSFHEARENAYFE